MYSTEVNGEILEFGTSGMLYRSNKLMYDRSTLTLWNQFLGEPAVGPLADSGIRLEVLPVVTTSWGDWVATHPDTTVLDIDTGVYPLGSYYPEENPRSIYYSYRNDPETMFPVWQRDDRLTAKAQVLGVRLKGQAKAYPLDVLAREVVVNDSLGGQALVVVAQSGAGAARAYQRDSNTFSPAQATPDEEEAPHLLDREGDRWRVAEDALVSVDDPGRRLERLPAHMAYWFGWYGFHPATEVYGQP